MKLFFFQLKQMKQFDCFLSKRMNKTSKAISSKPAKLKKGTPKSRVRVARINRQCLKEDSGYCIFSVIFFCVNCRFSR